MSEKIIKIISYLYPYKLIEFFGKVNQRLKMEHLKRNLNIKGKARIMTPCWISGKKYITIGEGFRAEAGLVLGVYDNFQGKTYLPKLTIGENVHLGFWNRITCCNEIVIGNNVLCAGKVFITDHFHGYTKKIDFNVPPVERELYSKGRVVIEDNVWIGEGVVVLPGVKIGEGAIIGANAVVTKDIPPRSIAAGVPAKVQQKI